MAALVVKHSEPPAAAASSAETTQASTTSTLGQTVFPESSVHILETLYMETGGPIPLDPDIEDPIRPTHGAGRSMTGVITETVSETTVHVEEYAAPVPRSSKLTAAPKKSGKKS